MHETSPLSDRQLLDRYLESRDGQVFAELVRRHVHLVHSAARRQSPEAADDITQAVFFLLSQRAQRVPRNRPLAGWLCQATRYCCANHNKREARRRHREQKAAAMAQAITPDKALERILPLLDESLAHLPASERDAVVVHYLEGKNLDQSGAELSISRDSTSKRAARGLEKLRRFFARRGYVVPTATVAALLTAEAAKAAPPALVTQAAAMGVHGAAVSLNTVALAKGAATMMTWVKVKMAALIVGAVVITGGAGVVVIEKAIAGPAATPRAVATTQSNVPLRTVAGEQVVSPAGDAAVGPPKEAGQEAAANPRVNPGAIPGVGQTVKVVVKDAEGGKPLAGVIVDARSGYQGEIRGQQTTDEAGMATFEGMIGMVVLDTEAAGRVPALIRWTPTPGKTLPAQFEFSLDEGVTMAGLAVDENGKPIAGAKVMLNAFKKNDVTGQQARPGFETVITDEQGRWTVSGVPAKPDSVEVGATHPEYLGDSGFISLTEYQDVAALLAGKATVKLKHGVIIDGVVRDPDGQPIRGATVGYGHDRMASNVIPEEPVKNDGTFRLGVPPGTEAVITVKAPGYAPELKRVKVANAPVKVTFDMQLPQMLSGSVVDAAGKPIPGARVMFDTWCGARTLDDHDVEADEAGRFTWDGAPADEILAYVSKQGYGSKQRVKVKAGEENLITLVATTRFQGKVLDAVTGEPIKKFNVTPGIVFEGEPVHWDRGDHGDNGPVRPGAGAGEFELRLGGDYAAMKVRVEAEGYMPADSENVPLDGKSSAFTFKLEKGTAIEGTVLGTDGRPVQGAVVVLVEGGISLQMNYAFWEHEQPSHAHTATDSAGRFQFPPQAKPYALAIVRPEGAAVVRRAEFEKTHTVTLQKWGRIEGQAKVGTQPARGVGVMMGSQHRPAAGKPGEESFVAACEPVKVDDAGKFVIDHVFPGVASLYMVREVGTMTFGNTEATQVEVKAGETARVQIGGKGRAVAGKMSVSPDERLKGAAAKWVTLMQVTPPSTQPAWSLPVEVMELPRQEVMAWQKKFAESEEGRKIGATIGPRINDRRQYSAPVAANGTFRIADVAPGSYWLMITWFAADADFQHEVHTAPIGRLSRQIEVPEVTGGATDVPVEAGELVPGYIGELKVGDPAPAAKLEGMDGKALTLADYRGKYLLLVVWAPYSRETLPPAAAGELWEKYKNDSRMALLGLAPQRSSAGVKMYVQARNISWPVALFNVQSYLEQQLPLPEGSAAWLIGPDGKVVAAKLTGDEIKAAVEKALGN